MALTDKNGTNEEFYAFRLGKESLWCKIVEDNSPWLYVLCYRLLWSSDDAQEAVQECFLLAFKQRLQLGNYDSLQGWLRQICIRNCIRNKRKKRPLSLYDVNENTLPDSQIYPYEAAIAEEERKQVLEGLAKLSPRQQYCLILSIFGGLTVSEIAQVAGLSKGTVRRYIFEARKFLCRYLNIGQEK